MFMEKLIINSIKEVEENWEKIKKKEKKYKNVLENIPKSLPPVTKSMRIQKKFVLLGLTGITENKLWKNLKKKL